MTAARLWHELRALFWALDDALYFQGREVFAIDAMPAEAWEQARERATHRDIVAASMAAAQRRFRAEIEHDLIRAAVRARAERDRLAMRRRDAEDRRSSLYLVGA